MPQFAIEQHAFSSDEFHVVEFASQARSVRVWKKVITYFSLIYVNNDKLHINCSKTTGIIDARNSHGSKNNYVLKTCKVHILINNCLGFWAKRLKT